MSWHTFKHEAMATYFEVALAASDSRYAAQAAAAVFREVDRLEQELSRFVDSSDIARVNRLNAGEALTVGVDAFECLLVAADVFLATQGAFDCTYASSREIGNRRHDDPGFELVPETHSIIARADRLHVDLGAIGKGYALDVGAELLRDWQLAAACLVAGGSTVMALDPPPDLAGWSIGVGDEPTVRRLSLRNSAVSASGTAVKGRHIADPRSGQPPHRQSRTWALASSGALSDALSTAFFVMSDSEIERFCREHPEIGAAVTLAGGQLQLYGALVPLVSP